MKKTDGKLNAVSVAPAAPSTVVPLKPAAAPAESWGQACSIDDPTCEACQ